MGDSVFGKDAKCKKRHKTNSLSQNPSFIFSLAYRLGDNDTPYPNNLSVALKPHYGTFLKSAIPSLIG